MESFRDILKENIEVLLEDYKFTIESLSKITQVDPTALQNYLDGKDSRIELPMLEYAYFSHTIFALAQEVKGIDDDNRVKAIVELLISEFGVNLQTLSVYTGVELEDIDSFMKDKSISCEKKYKIAVTSMLLHYMFKKITISQPRK